MNLNETPSGTLLCMYNTGEFLKLVDHTPEFCMVQTERGEHYCINQAEASNVSCVAVTNQARADAFTRNASLGHALRSAELAALRIVGNAREAPEEVFAAQRTADHILFHLDIFERRIETVRAASTLGPEISSAFLDSFLRNPDTPRSDSFLGREVVLGHENTIKIEGIPHDLNEGAALLASFKPKPVLRSLDDMMRDAHARQRRSSDGRGRSRSLQDLIH